MLSHTAENSQASEFNLKMDLISTFDEKMDNIELQKHFVMFSQ